MKFYLCETKPMSRWGRIYDEMDRLNLGDRFIIGDLKRVDGTLMK